MEIQNSYLPSFEGLAQKIQNLSDIEQLVYGVALVVFTYFIFKALCNLFTKKSVFKIDENQRFEGIFKGSILNEGTLYRKDFQQKLSGEFYLKDGKLTGKGKMGFVDKFAFDGECEEDILKKGTLSSLGEKYEIDGDFTYDGYLVTGKGKFIHKNYTYEGTVVEGKMREGMVYWDNGEEWKVDFKEKDTGLVTIWYKDGRVFSGSMINGNTTSGRICLPNGDIYEGFVDNKQRAHGEGKYVTSEGEIFNGPFVKGKQIKTVRFSNELPELIPT